jgi:hypothetical protein
MADQLAFHADLHPFGVWPGKLLKIPSRNNLPYI